MNATETASSIRGWLFRDEPEELERLARGKVVLEVGSYCGKSTVVMARVAQRVIAVDDFRGGTGHDDFGIAPADCTPDKLREEFFHNLDEHGVRDKVTVFVAQADHVLSTLSLADVGLVFYDADHSYSSTYSNARRLFDRLPATATIVFHDYHDSDPGVIRAVDQIRSESGRKFRRVGTLAIFDGVQSVPTKDICHRVMIAFPGKSFIFGAVRGVWQATFKHDIRIRTSGTGWDDFNIVWCDALNDFENGAITHAAMLHSDIGPEPGWLDTLLEEMDRLGADFVSAPAPIKDRRGVTSSGIGDPDDRWNPFRRFTVRELCDFPETFSADDVGYPGGILLHNTGCWVADLRNPLFRATDPDGCLTAFFDFPRRVSRNEKGRWNCRCESEDWYFSRKLHQLGAKTYICRKPRLVHQGVAEYPNNEPWGTYFHGDEDTKEKWGKPPQ